LVESKFIETSERLDKCTPVGFCGDVEWYPQTKRINPCLRLSKYVDSKGFEPHRDGQFTSAQHIRSNRSIVLFLNDTEDDSGALEFIVPKKQYDHLGETIPEELKRVGMDNFRTYQVVPQKGMAVIFDQRLIHRVLPVKGSKYILRTDLVKEGKLISEHIVSEREKQCRRIFRMAQLADLEGKSTSKDLYETAISLRLSPILGTNPKLTKMLEKSTIPPKPSSPPKGLIKYVNRKGTSYHFQIAKDCSTHWWAVLQASCFFTMYIEARSVGSTDRIEEWYDTICKNSIFPIINKLEASHTITTQRKLALKRLYK